MPSYVCSLHGHFYGTALHCNFCGSWETTADHNDKRNNNNNTVLIVHGVLQLFRHMVRFKLQLFRHMVRFKLSDSAAKWGCHLHSPDGETEAQRRGVFACLGSPRLIRVCLSCKDLRQRQTYGDGVMGEERSRQNFSKTSLSAAPPANRTHGLAVPSGSFQHPVCGWSLSLPQDVEPEKALQASGTGCVEEQRMGHLKVRMFIFILTNKRY